MFKTCLGCPTVELSDMGEGCWHKQLEFECCSSKCDGNCWVINNNVMCSGVFDTRATVSVPAWRPTVDSGRRTI